MVPIYKKIERMNPMTQIELTNMNTILADPRKRLFFSNCSDGIAMLC